MSLYSNNQRFSLLLNGNKYDFLNFVSSRFYYVSLGDSIPAGHSINSDWVTDYGEGTQYGKNGNTYTVIVPNSYTDLLWDEFKYTCDNGVTATSFARSGDTVEDLIDKLDHAVVRSAIARADVVTVCIGANNVLQPALNSLGDYINTGNPALNALGAIVDANLAILNDDNNSNSYTALFNKLNSINPDATYVFTNIYNPLKYLWIDESTAPNDYKDGFFGPLMWAIPDLGNASNLARSALYNTDAVQTIFDRINGPSRDGSDGLAIWTETYICRLNQILQTKLANYNNPNFIYADTKALFDSFPDRPVSANIHYNDLVNIEFTRGYKVEDMDWAQFWSNFSIDDILGNAETIMGNVMANVVNNVIIPDIDPHPETYGHYAMMRTFAEKLNLANLNHYTITFNANGGTGTMAPQHIVGVDGMTAYGNIKNREFTPVEGYNFAGWNTAADGSGVSYSNKQLIGLTSDITLYAQWSNMCKITYMHTNHTNGLYGQDETGHMECYALWIAGTEMPDLGKFSDNNVPVYSYPYGTRVGVVLSNYNPNELLYDDCNCDVYMNGVNVASGYRGTAYEFTLTSDVVIDFRWKVAGSLATFNARSWEDCYITTT